MRILAQAKRLVHEVLSIWRIGGARMAASYAAAIARTLPRILRERRLEAADAGMRGAPEYRVHYYGAELRLPGRCFSGIREMYARDVYLWPQGLSLSPGDTVIDLGCNQGLFATFAAKRGARVIAVDGQAGFRAEMLEHLKRNDCGQNVVFEAAVVGAETGLFSDAAQIEAGSHFAGKPAALTMSSLFERHRVASVAFLKMDIEGSEFALFQGEADWLNRVNRLAMEVHSKFGDPASIVDFLARRGFDAFVTDSELNAGKPIAANASGYIYASRRGASA